MAITNYSVLIGTKAGYHRDDANNFGKFFHGHIDVQTPTQLYNTAIDVDSERPGVSVQWRLLHLRPAEWTAIFALPDGLHPLTSNSTSGAVDYYRDPRFQTFAVIPEYIDGPVPWWKRIPEKLQPIKILIEKLSQSPSVTKVTSQLRRRSAPVTRLLLPKPRHRPQPGLEQRNRPTSTRRP